VLDIARRYWDQGIATSWRCVGDPAGRHDRYEPRADGFAYAADLVKGCAAWPTSRSRWRRIPRNIPRRRAPSSTWTISSARSTPARSRAITQFFYDTQVFLRFRDSARRAASTRPSCRASCRSRASRRSRRFARRCGATIPDWLEHRFDGLEDDAETRKMISAAVAIEQVHMLQRHGVEQFHSIR
jgi:methylenetetrahydrofolate reductase (NADPH)